MQTAVFADGAMYFRINRTCMRNILVQGQEKLWAVQKNQEEKTLQACFSRTEDRKERSKSISGSKTFGVRFSCIILRIQGSHWVILITSVAKEEGCSNPTESNGTQERDNALLLGLEIKRSRKR